MKAIKKVFAMLLAVVMTLGLSVTAFAESGGSIAIDNAASDKTYSIYRVFDLVTDNVKGSTAYKYMLNSSWSDLASYSATIDGTTVSANSLFT